MANFPDIEEKSLALAGLFVFNVKPLVSPASPVS
jgi:hypothetical protein